MTHPAVVDLCSQVTLPLFKSRSFTWTLPAFRSERDSRSVRLAWATVFGSLVVGSSEIGLRAVK